MFTFWRRGRATLQHRQQRRKAEIEEGQRTELQPSSGSCN